MTRVLHRISHCSSKCPFLLVLDSCFTQVAVFVVFCSYKKRDGDLALAHARIKELESQYNQSEASRTTALCENAALTAEIAELKKLLAKVRLLTLLCFPRTINKHS